MADIAISIVTYNNAATIGACLTTVSTEIATAGLEATVSVVDNSPTVDTATLVEREFPWVELIRPGENLGFGRGHNLVLRRWSAPLSLVLNPDAQLQPGALALLLKALRENPSVALVGPRVEYAEGWPQLSFGFFPGFLADLRQRSFTRAVKSRHLEALRRLEALMSRRLYPDWISGSCLLARTDDLRRVGGFDEDYFLYLEDVDLCRRLAEDGRRVMVEPAAVCRHLEGGSFGNSDAPAAHYRRSRLIYENRFGSRFGFRLYQLLRGDAGLRYDPARRWKSGKE